MARHARELAVTGHRAQGVSPADSHGPMIGSGTDRDARRGPELDANGATRGVSACRGSDRPGWWARHGLSHHRLRRGPCRKDGLAAARACAGADARRLPRWTRAAGSGRGRADLWRHLPGFPPRTWASSPRHLRRIRRRPSRRSVLGPELGRLRRRAGSGAGRPTPYSRLLRRPALVPLVPGILLLVPGSIRLRASAT